MAAAAELPTLLLAQLFLHTYSSVTRSASIIPYRMIPAAGNSRYDTGFHLIRYAYEYTERCRSLSAGAKIKYIRYDYEYEYAPTRNDVAPYRLALKSNSSGTTTSMMYNLRKTFEKIRDFSVFLI